MYERAQSSKQTTQHQKYNIKFYIEFIDWIYNVQYISKQCMTKYRILSDKLQQTIHAGKIQARTVQQGWVQGRLLCIRALPV